MKAILIGKKHIEYKEKQYVIMHFTIPMHDSNSGDSECVILWVTKEYYDKMENRIRNNEAKDYHIGWDKVRKQRFVYVK